MPGRQEVMKVRGEGWKMKEIARELVRGKRGKRKTRARKMGRMRVE
jgi:hypothetical protein